MSHDTEETEADWIINDRQFCANEIFKILAAGQLLEEGWWIITRSCFLSIHWSVTVGYFHSYPIMRESWRSPRFFLFLSSFLKEIKQFSTHSIGRQTSRRTVGWRTGRQMSAFCFLMSRRRRRKHAQLHSLNWCLRLKLPHFQLTWSHTPCTHTCEINHFTSFYNNFQPRSG